MPQHVDANANGTALPITKVVEIPFEPHVVTCFLNCQTSERFIAFDGTHVPNQTVGTIDNGLRHANRDGTQDASPTSVQFDLRHIAPKLSRTMDTKHN